MIAASASQGITRTANRLHASSAQLAQPGAAGLKLAQPVQQDTPTQVTMMIAAASQGITRTANRLHASSAQLAQPGAAELKLAQPVQQDTSTQATTMTAARHRLRHRLQSRRLQ